MRCLTKLTAVVALLLVVAAAAGCATTQPFTVQTIQTKDLHLLYPQDEAYLAPYAARSFENSMAFQEKIFGWKPWEPTRVLLTDLRDYGNAGASGSPHNAVTVFIAPDDPTLETSPGSERMFMTANHELVHVATMDGWNQRDKGWRKFFGGKPRAIDEHPETILYNYLTIPRFSVPRWYLEGSAVFMETWMAGGFGRAQGAYDEMVFRAMVRDDAHFYSPLGLVSEGTKVDFQGLSNAYLYGTRFMSYLALHYSPQMLVDWLKRGDGSKAYYTDQFQQVFHVSLDQAWSDWIAWEHAFQRKNLEKVRQFPLTKTKRLTSRVLGSVSRTYYDPHDGNIIGAFFGPGVLAHVGVLSLHDGSERHLVDINGPKTYSVTSTAYDPASETFFYDENNSDHRDLRAVDVRTGKSRLLLKAARIGDLAFDQADRSLWGLRTMNGYVSLVQIPYPYTDWKTIHTWPYGVIAFSLSVSHDGSMLSASMGEIDGKKYLRIFKIADLLAKKAEPFAEFDFGQAVPEGFVFTADDRYLYGSSYYTGISNIYRYEIATKQIEAVSNAETGFFRPMPMPDGKLTVLEFTGQGFTPVVIDPKPLQDLSAITFLGSEIANQHPIVKTWGVGSPNKIDLDPLITKKGAYVPVRNIRPQTRYPVIEGYRGDFALGWHYDFADELNLYKLSIDGAVSNGPHSEDGERYHLAVNYSGLHWYANYWHNYADFYDLFGPIETSRKGDAVIVGYKDNLLHDGTRDLDLDSRVAYYTGLDTLPGNQNVGTHLDSILVAQAGLKYANIKKTRNAVDREQGIAWNVNAAMYQANGQTIPQAHGGFDFGFLLPMPHMSIWLYNAVGASGGRRNNSLANYYFGGFHNNYVDNTDPKHYRQFESFPGFGIDEIAGHTFAKSTLELNLPPWRLEEVGSPGFYLSHIRPAIFGGVLVTDPDRSALRRTWRDLGFQLDLTFSVLNYLPMTLSAGYAWGFSDGQRTSREWMLSLKIL